MLKQHVTKYLPIFVMAMLGLLASAQPGYATTIVIPNNRDLAIGARAIVRARVLTIETRYDQAQDMVFSYITLRVNEVLKGDISQRRIVLKEIGGQYLDRQTVIYGAPEFFTGERVLVYLESAPDGSLRVHDLFLGKFSIIVDPNSGQEMAVRTSLAENTSVIPNSANAPMTDRMELEAYLRMVRNEVASTIKESKDFEEEHYRDVPLRAMPMDYEPSLGQQIFPQFTLLGTPPSRWFEPDFGQNVGFVVKLAGAPTSTAFNDVTAALNAWSAVSGSSIRLVNRGTTTQCSPSAGVNTITFDNCQGRFSPSSGCSGTLAIGGYTRGTETKTINGTSFNRILHGFVTTNPYLNCFLGSSCNLREIMTHEIGHTLGLGHSWQPSFLGSPTAIQSDATMFWSAHGDGRCASLRTDDINGVRFIYPTATAPTLVVSPSSINSVTVVGGPNPGEVVLSIGSSGAPFTWSLRKSAPWLTVSQTTGSTPATVRVIMNVAGLVTAPYTDTIVITGNGAANSPVSIPVSMIVNPLMTQGGFESSTGWTFSGNAILRFNSSQAFSGSGFLSMGEVNGASGTASQVINLPVGSRASLRCYVHVVTSETTTSVIKDRLFIEVRDLNNNLLANLDTVTNLNRTNPSAYILKGAYPLGQFAGRSIKLQFRVQNDNTLPTTFRIDHCSMYQ